jgi:transposase
MATLGIDISKADFHAFLLLEGKGAKHSFPNSAVGFKQLLTWLKNRGVDRVFACMEATGPYWEALAVDLHAAGHDVSVVNPSRTKAFAQSELLRTKTDAIDAAMIARFALATSPALWEPPAAEVRMLQALVRHLEQLKTARAAQQMRQKLPALPAVVATSIAEVIEALDAQIDEIEKAIRDHIDRHPGLKSQSAALQSIKGLGETTAALILAEIPMIEHFSSGKAVAAYAGLSPRIVQSGSSLRHRGRLSRTGNARLRKALYMPALSAMRFNPVLKTFAARLHARGKVQMIIVAAVMRKLLVLAYGVIKSGRHFDPAFGTRAA